ncbi:FixH family protein [Pseudoroseicyclus sp. H15]
MTTLNGRHVALMFVGGFGIIIAVNVSLAVNAVRTFPGLEVANSYVASQLFDDKRAAQEALGWEVGASYENGILALDITDATGLRAPAQDLTLHVGRPTEERDDVPAPLDANWTVPLDLAPGLWRLDVAANAPDGTPFVYQMVLRVRS